jgi:putative oxygen-independent coproporphyrinogen III oxidase
MNAADQDDSGFGLYVHWPFCAAKCPYCDFNSHVRHAPVDQDAFVRAYLNEIAFVAERCPGRSVTSIFFGGGTPSLMAPATVGAIIEAAAMHWTLSGDAEITLEANPNSADAGRFAGYRDAGVNRLSLGVQSLDDRQLKFLGRLHSAEEAREAILLARRTFPRMSFDMIYARPGQTLEDWRGELEKVLELSVDHLSLYQLTIEAGTAFFDLQARGRLKIPDSELAADLYEMTAEMAADAGLPAYEISNHAARGAQCRHNLTYWRYGEYAGIGPGAHGRLQIDGSRVATAALSKPEAWWEAATNGAHGYELIETLLPESAADEMLLMGLRLREGLSLDRYERTAGRPLDRGRIGFLESQGFLELVPASGHLRATPRGFLVLDAVIADLAA